LQTARVQRRHYKGRDADGAHVVVGTSLEDPESPEVIHNRISRAVDYIAENAENGFNEQQQARAVIVFIFTYWDEEIRPRLAHAKNLPSPNGIRVDAMGDLRLLRGAIIHNKGKLSSTYHQKMKVMRELFTPDADIKISHETMHQIFVRAKQGIGNLILEHVGKRPGAPEIGEIREVAIQRIGKVT
jgi:hypothetical protein